jgi:hypothetical protein
MLMVTLAKTMSRVFPHPQKWSGSRLKSLGPIDTLAFPENGTPNSPRTFLSSFHEELPNMMTKTERSFDFGVHYSTYRPPKATLTKLLCPLFSSFSIPVLFLPCTGKLAALYLLLLDGLTVASLPASECLLDRLEPSPCSDLGLCFLLEPDFLDSRSWLRSR